MAPIKWNRIFEKIQNKSGKEKITIVVLTGILLLVISLPTGSKSGQTETNENTQTRQTGLSESAKSYETVLEEKLEKALKKVEGVGEVSVVITLKNTSEKIIAADSDYSESVIQESDSAGGVRSTTQQSGAIFITIRRRAVSRMSPKKICRRWRALSLLQREVVTEMYALILQPRQKHCLEYPHIKLKF